MVEHSFTGTNYCTSTLLIVLILRRLLKIVTFSLWLESVHAITYLLLILMAGAMIIMFTFI